MCLLACPSWHVSALGCACVRCWLQTGDGSRAAAVMFLCVLGCVRAGPRQFGEGLPSCVRGGVYHKVVCMLGDACPSLCEPAPVLRGDQRVVCVSKLSAVCMPVGVCLPYIALRHECVEVGRWLPTGAGIAGAWLGPEACSQQGAPKASPAWPCGEVVAELHLTGWCLSGCATLLPALLRGRCVVA